MLNMSDNCSKKNSFVEVKSRRWNQFAINFLDSRFKKYFKISFWSWLKTIVFLSSKYCLKLKTCNLDFRQQVFFLLIQNLQTTKHYLIWLILLYYNCLLIFFLVLKCHPHFKILMPAHQPLQWHLRMMTLLSTSHHQNIQHHFIKVTLGK